MTPDEERQAMVHTQLACRGISDERVLEAMASVPRHLFVPEEWRAQAYQDRALPIEAGQTISQPFIVALMAQALALRGDERVLEIGAGSGYAAAVLSLLATEVYTVAGRGCRAPPARPGVRKRACPRGRWDRRAAGLRAVRRDCGRGGGSVGAEAVARAAGRWWPAGYSSWRARRAVAAAAHAERQSGPHRAPQRGALCATDWCARLGAARGRLTRK